MILTSHYYQISIMVTDICPTEYIATMNMTVEMKTLDDNVFDNVLSQLSGPNLPENLGDFP